MPSVARRYAKQENFHQTYKQVESARHTVHKDSIAKYAVHAHVRESSEVSRQRLRSIERKKSLSKAQKASIAPVILMVSGGADSTALLLMALSQELNIEDGRGCARIARERLHILHINHCLRGQSAFDDEAFVRDIAGQHGIACTVRRIDVRQLAQNTSDNVENAGRIARYQAAYELADTLSAQLHTPKAAARILTAHTANDRAETFFINAIKGASLRGLSSIPRRRGRIVRPLLDKTHEELCEYLRTQQIIWREDQTNKDINYTRAFVRHELLSCCKKINPNVIIHTAQNCTLLADEDAFLTSMASRTKKLLVKQATEHAHILDARKLAALEVALARRIVRMELLELAPEERFDARHIHAILTLVAQGSGTVCVCGNITVNVQHGLLFIKKPGAPKSFVSGWLDIPGSFNLDDGYILIAQQLKVAPESDPADLALTCHKDSHGYSALIDARKCEIDPLFNGHFWIDHAQPGDTFCPFGMHGQSKKLSDFLSERIKIRSDRCHVPIIRTSQRGPIVWVGTQRVDERVRVSAQTQEMIQLSIRKS